MTLLPSMMRGDVMVSHTKDVEDLLAQARAHEHRLVLIERTDDKVYGEGAFA